MRTHRSKKETVHDTLLERIVNGDYRMGEKILIKRLIEETGASRQPVMSALSDLRAEGLVSITAQVGCEVVSPNARQTGDFYLMFGRLEGLLAELAAQRAAPTEVIELREINDQIRRLPVSKPSSAKAYPLLNREFHARLHSMAESPSIADRQMYNFAMADFLISQTCGFAVHLRDAVREHDAIIESIARGNGAQSRLLTERHIGAVARLVVSRMHEKFATEAQSRMGPDY